jgi:hypothetical protein
MADLSSLIFTPMKKIHLCLPGLLITVLVLFTYCKNKITEETDTSGNKIIKEWFGENRIKSIKTLYQGAQNHYLIIQYNRKGNLIDSARYLNDSIEGTRKFYESKTELLHTENYRHGVLEGIHKAVYPNGVTGFEGFRKNDMMVGEWEFHFASGHPITYEYYDSSGVMRYFRKYDDNGNVLKVDGIGMIQIKSDQTRLDSTGILSGFIEAVIPPGCKSRFTVEEDGAVTGRRKYLEVFINKPKYDWEIKLEGPGEINLKYILTIIDNKTGSEEVSASEQTVLVQSNLK